MELLDVILAIICSFHTPIASFWYFPRCLLEFSWLTYDKDITYMIYSKTCQVQFEYWLSLLSDVLKSQICDLAFQILILVIHLENFPFLFFCFWCTWRQNLTTMRLSSRLKSDAIWSETENGKCTESCLMKELGLRFRETRSRKEFGRC